MKRSVPLLLILIYLLCSFFVEKSDYVNLKIYIESNKLYDIGKGWWYGYQPDRPLSNSDSIFCYNYFVCDSLWFKGKTNTSFQFNEKTYHVVFSKDDDVFEKVYLKCDDEIIFRQNLSDKLQITAIDTIYDIKFYNQNLMLIYLKSYYSSLLFGDNYLGILVDMDIPSLTVLPSFQGTNTPLPFTDFDSNKQLHYINYWPLNSVDTIKIYSYVDGKFILENQWTSILSKTEDNLLGIIRSNGNDFISNCYRNNKYRILQQNKKR